MKSEQNSVHAKIITTSIRNADLHWAVARSDPRAASQVLRTVAERAAVAHADVPRLVL